MDPFSATVMVSTRDHAGDPAFSALPDAPRQEPRHARRPVRRAVAVGLLRAAYRLEPATR